MSTQPLGITNFGAFTLQAAQAIQAAMQSAGLGTTGNVYYVNPAAGNDIGPGTTPQTAFQTLGAGYAALTEGNNDVLVLIGNGLSSGSARLSAAFTWAKDAAHLIGICAPSSISQRARIAPFTGAAQAAFANFFTVTGNGCLFSNVSWFQGFTAGVAASICLTISGSRNVFLNCDIEGMGDATSAASATSRNLKIVGPAGENRFAHCNIGLDTITRTGANASVEFSGATVRNSFEDCTFPFYSGDGNTLGILGTGADCLDRWQMFKNCAFMNCIKSGATQMTVLASLTNAAPGGFFLLYSCISVGSTKLGDTNALANTYVLGPTPVSGAYLAINPA